MIECARCGYRNDAAAKFCAACGAPMMAAQQQVPQGPAGYPAPAWGPPPGAPPQQPQWGPPQPMQQQWGPAPGQPMAGAQAAPPWGAPQPYPAAQQAPYPAPAPWGAPAPQPGNLAPAPQPGYPQAPLPQPGTPGPQPGYPPAPGTPAPAMGAPAGWGALPPAMPGAPTAQPPLGPTAPDAVAAAPAAPTAASAVIAPLEPDEIPANAPKTLAAFLVTFDPNPLGQFWPLFQGQTLVGRKDASAELNLEIDHPTTSSRHAKIYAAARPGRLKVEDLGSTNGTYVNERRLEAGERRSLEAGDTLRFGGFSVTVVLL